MDFNDIHPTLAAVPPLDEQCAIADFLDHETSKVGKIFTTVEATIERLQEYCTALISAAVTGKIDLRPGRNQAESLAAPSDA